MKPLACLASVLSAMVLFTSTYAQDSANPLIGSRLYRSFCFVCHGGDGKGKGPLAKNLGLNPSDLSSEQYQTKKAEDLVAIIEGYWKKKDLTMPDWGIALSKQELLDIAAYIPKLTRKDLRFKGDTRRGRAIFKNACVACHGKSGVGNGVLARLIEIPMGDFTKSPEMSKLSDDELISIIRDGRKDYMPSWSGILSPSEIIDVATYIRLLAR